MASSSGNSSGVRTTTTTKRSNQLLHSSSSGEDLQQLMDERKRKRMESNRESARRSRMRKQKRLDDLTAQFAELRSENTQILNTMSLTTQRYLNVGAENSVLRAQMVELSHRLESLNEILNYINSTTGTGTGAGGGTAAQPGMELLSVDGLAANHWNLGHVNQPVMSNCVDYHAFGY